jgi:hypothetical protein
MTTKKIICGLAVLAVAVIATVNVAISNKNVSRLTDLQLANVEALASEASNDSESWNPVCINGGAGASQCSIGASVEIAGYGFSGDCSVTCNSGYYACCGIRCTCKKES